MKIVAVAGLAIACCAFAHDPASYAPPWQAPTDWPDRIIVTLEGDPSSSFSVSWRTHRAVGETIAQIAPATADARFDLAAESEKARTVPVSLADIDTPDGQRPVIQNQALEPVHYHSVAFRNLEPDRLYAYRVRGARGNWSAWRQVRTAPESGPVSFVFFGDAQTGIRSHVTRTFDAAAIAAPDARFIIHGGDLVNTAMYDKEWAEWYEAGGRTFVTVPSIPVAGNHDYVNLNGEKLYIADRMVSPLWRPQFALPITEELPEDLHETVYAVRYTSDLSVFVIDSSGIAFDRQMDWLSKNLEQSAAKWRVLTMHHPIYSFVGGNEHESARDRRLQLIEVLESHDVDLVMTGHRHTYQRAESGDEVGRYNVGEAHAVDTVFVVTASSTKRGETKVDGWQRFEEETGGRYALKRYGDYTPIFAVVRIDGDTLRYAALDATGAEYDAFTLTRGADGANSLRDGASAAGPVRTMETTGPYIDWNDLR